MAASDPPSPDPRDIATINIISSHKISAKISRCLSLLYAPDTAAQTVGLRVKAPVASKAITIAEIVKRRVDAQGDRWYQYTRLESVLEEKKMMNNVKAAALEEKETEEEEEEDNPFETMQEKEHKQVRATPVLTIYISRMRLPAYAKLFGEQTNAAS